MDLSDIIIGKFQDVGPNSINIDKVVNKWNHLWILSEWRDDGTWKLTKLLRKDSDIKTFKTAITPYQAKELINRLKLKAHKTIFNSGFSWSNNETTI